MSDGPEPSAPAPPAPPAEPSEYEKMAAELAAARAEAARAQQDLAVLRAKRAVLPVSDAPARRSPSDEWSDMMVRQISQQIVGHAPTKKE